MNKYLCTIETKNYPVRNITPMMTAYARMDRNVSKTEILACLEVGAIVTLHKPAGGTVRLTRENLTKELTAAMNTVQSAAIKEVQEEKKEENKTHVEELKKQLEDPKPVATEPTTTSAAAPKTTTTSKKKSANTTTESAKTTAAVTEEKKETTTK